MLLTSKAVKKLLPKQVKRFILLNFLGVRRRYDHLRSHPSRRFLGSEILPWLSAHFERVLFVGTGPYTWQFERLFRRSRDHYTTVDPESATAVWGARNHFVAPVQEIGRYRPKGYFDCIVFNGVFGFGINDLDGQREAIKELHDALTISRRSACSSPTSYTRTAFRGRTGPSSRCPKRTSTTSTRSGSSNRRAAR